MILVANKIDKLADKGKLFGIIESYTKDFTFAAVVPVSALKDTEFPGLVNEITKYFAGRSGIFPGRYDNRPAGTDNCCGNDSRKGTAVNS